MLLVSPNECNTFHMTLTAYPKSRGKLLDPKSGFEKTLLAPSMGYQARATSSDEAHAKSIGDISGLPKTRITTFSPHLLQLLQRMLQCCFAAKLHECQKFTSLSIARRTSRQ